MSSVIFRHSFDETCGLRLPMTATIRHVGVKHVDDPLPTLWVEHDRDFIALPPEEKHLLPESQYVVVGTGQDIPDYVTYVGTAVCANGDLVWHVFKVGD